MPRQSYPFKSFRGGINQVDTIYNGYPECKTAIDLVPEGDGMRMMGGEASVLNDSGTNVVQSALQVGFGFFVMATDYTLSTTITSQSRNVFYALGGNDSNATRVEILDTSARQYRDVTGGAAIEVDSVSDAKITYYYSEGQLRMGNADKSMTTTTAKWFGWIDRWHKWSTSQQYKGWYVENAELAPPTIDKFYYGGIGSGEYSTYYRPSTVLTAISAVSAGGAVTTAVNHNLEAGDKVYLATDQDTAGDIYSVTSVTSDVIFNLDAAGTADHGSATEGEFLYCPYTEFSWCVGLLHGSVTGTTDPTILKNWQCALTYVYDGNQESPMSVFPQSVLLSDYAYNNIIKWGLWVYTYQSSGTPSYLSNQRITGLKVYLKDAEDTEWMLYGYADLLRGGYAAVVKDSGQSIGWYFRGIYTTSTWRSHACYLLSTNPSPGYEEAGAYSSEWNLLTTYTQETGYSPTTTQSVMSHWKSAVIANRTAYVGNVKFNGVSYPDSIFKSRVNKYDMFDLNRSIAAAVNDGEDINDLKVYNDRILVFKTNMLYVLNVSQEIEFIESIHRNLGVDEPYQVCESEFGVAWVNDNGCFLYTGSSVIDLLLDPQDQTRRRIKLSTWQSFLSTSPYIFYDPTGKRFIVGDDIGKSSSVDLYVYSIIEGGWTTGTDKITSSSVYRNSNPMVDPTLKASVWNYYDDQVTYTNTIYKWDDTPDTSTNMLFESLAHDFGERSLLKNFYYMTLSYRVTATSNANIKFHLDSNRQGTFGTMLGFLDSGSWGNVIGATAQVWYKRKYTLDGSFVTNKFTYSIDISNTSGTVPASFQFEDMEIVGRIKGHQSR